MPDVVRIGALARSDPDAQTELDFWKREARRGAIDDPRETLARLEAHERGEAHIVRLELYAELLDGDSVEKVDGLHVPGVWFERGQAAANETHAHDVVVQHLDELREDVLQSGADAGVDELAALPFRLELDHELSARIR